MLRRLTVVATATTVVSLLGACADSATAPVRDDFDPSSRLPDAAVVVDRMASDKSSADFTVTPGGGYFNLGPHGIYFPAYAICDPRTSAYSPTEWDKPCEVLREPIQIHAELRHQDGRYWVFFTPELRFVPSSDWKRAVYIYMMADGKKMPRKLKPNNNQADPRNDLIILYSPHIGAPGIDESIDDPSLRTFVHGKSGFVYRRIKHFSGYHVHERLDVGLDRDDQQ